MWKPSPTSSRRKALRWPDTAVPPTPAVERVSPSRTPEGLSTWLKGKALHFGFASAGITSASALFSRDAEMQAWLDRGRAGPLGYMQNFFLRRSHFLQLIPDLKSILVLTVPYPREGNRLHSSPAGQAAGRIARYAGGKDYHRVVRKMLKRFSASLREAAGPATRILPAVDTSPISERTLGEAAGIGFFGKNSCLIQPRGGSYFFLAALLTNLELTSDHPIRWDCGSCTRCIQACPTGALEEPYQLNATRCISALTIELRGNIPTPLRPLLADWLFGCDICQEVCPYNHPARSPAPSKEGAGDSLPSLSELLLIRTEEEFRRHFSGTPLRRPGRAGLLRNAALVAAHLGLTELVPVLTDVSRNDPSPTVRLHADWARRRLTAAVVNTSPPLTT